MDFGSFLKRRELEKQAQEHIPAPGRSTATGAPRSIHNFKGTRYPHNHVSDSSYHQPHPHTQHSEGFQWHYEGGVSTNMATRGNFRSQYEQPFGSLRPPMPGIGPSRGRGFHNQTRGRGILKNKSRYQDETFKEAETTPSYRTSNYENDNQGSQSCSYEETYQSYEDYTQDNAPNNFADVTMYSTQYGLNANVQDYIETADRGQNDDLNDKSKKVTDHGHHKTAADKEKEENLTPVKTQNSTDEKKDETKAENEDTTDGKKNDESEKKDGDSDDDDDDDEASEPAQHGRGLMGTLICMLGNDALNRKPDPVPPPQPAKLHPKEQLDTYFKHKEPTYSAIPEDHQGDYDDNDEYEGFDVMDLPPEERDLKPDHFDFGPNSDLYCKVCGVQTTSMKNFQDHLDGKNHRSKLANIAKGKIINTTKVGKKRMIMSKTDLGKKSLVLETLESNKSEPIIGLSFITEYQSISQVMCVCNLCGVKFDHNAALSHVSGAKHRYQYMKEKRPIEYVHAKRFGGKKTQLVTFLQELSGDVETEDTRGEPVIKVFDTDEKPVDQTKLEDESKMDIRQSSNKENGSSEGAGQRHSTDKDNIKRDQDGELFFNSWVESECSKSREAREKRKSPSPPPRQRNDDRAHPHDRDRPNKIDLGSRRDHFSPAPQERFSFGGPHTPRFPPGHFDSHPHNFPRRPPFLPYPSWGPRFDKPSWGHGNFPPRGPPGHPDYSSWEHERPSRHASHSSRPHERPNRHSGHHSYEDAPPAPYLDPDPVKRLDMLRKAKQEAGSVQKHPPKEEPYLDPDPLKRISKREAVMKPKVIDYSHGTAMNERRPERSESRKADKWEDDIQSILGYYKSKGLDSLATLGNAYSSSDRKPSGVKKVGKEPPFSKSYLDIPENKKRLQDLRKKAQSPPIPGIGKRGEALNENRKRSRSSSSSSSSSYSPSSRKSSRSKDTKLRGSLARYSSPLNRQDDSPHQLHNRKRSRSGSPISFSDRRARSSRSPQLKMVNHSREKKSPAYRRNEKESPLDRRDLKGSSPNRKITEREIEDRLGSSKNPIRLFNDDKKDKDPLFHSCEFGKDRYSEERQEKKRYELNRPSSSSDRSRAKEEILNFKMSTTKSRDKTNLERERPPEASSSENKNQKSLKRELSPQVSPPRYRKYKSQEREKPPSRDMDRRCEDRGKKQETYNSAKETPYPDDNEDAQAERIADMLLSMSSVLTSSGDTQATLQALLSNPEVAETILKAQAEMEKKSSEKRANERSPSAGLFEGRDRHGTRSSPHHSRSQRESALTSKSSERKSHAPTRERVAFSLSGKIGRGSLQQSAAFAHSSDEDTD